jgi:hypothetical protein
MMGFLFSLHWPTGGFLGLGAAGLFVVQALWALICLLLLLLLAACAG